VINVTGVRDVEIRHLAALQAVAREGTFGRAAAALGFSQAAVSQQIAGLEKAVGTAVFDRPGGPRPVRLTPAGRLLLGHADDVLDRLATADAELTALRAGTGGRLAVGTFQSVSVRLLPSLISTLHDEAPDLAISVVPAEFSSDLVTSLLEGRLDVAFLDIPVDHPDLAVDLVLRDPYVVVTRPDDPLLASHPKGYPMAAIGERPMVGHEACDALAAIEAHLLAHGVRPQYAFRTNDNGALQAMVAAGMGPALMPLLAVDESDPSVQVVHTHPALPARRVSVARPRGAGLLPAAERLAALAVAAGAALSSTSATAGPPRRRART
jgi:DNA-binding transcriptional LysR family regulator